MPDSASHLGNPGFMLSEQMMQQEDPVRDLVYRLLDYRITTLVVL